MPTRKEETINKAKADQIAKEICDVIYVAVGIACMYGIDLEPVWAAVHESNMAKGPQSEPCDGKVPKPDGWQAPDIESILCNQETDLTTV